MGLRSFYIVTDENDMELIHIMTNQTQVFRPCMVENYGVQEPMYQIMWDDSIVGEGTFVKDYVSFDAPTQDFQLFLNRNLDK